MFLDEIDLHVLGGKGGQGCLSFRREKYVPKGGPDGGEGGDGGAVVLRADAGLSSLHHLKGFGIFQAKNGNPGGPNNRTGKRGEDLVLKVPVGTVVKDAERGNLLADLNEEGKEIVVAAGGRRGRGNKSFASSTNRVPRQFEKGMPGEERRVHLVLKMIADVGLVGFPNAGKSTLISVLSEARPKVAAYPFTTLVPNLGIVHVPGFRRFVMADIPGLIEGASDGKGLGHQFLRHIERTRLLLIMVDLSAEAIQAPEEAFRVLEKELQNYSEILSTRPKIYVGTKVENEASEALRAELESLLGKPILGISSILQKGLPQLIRRILSELSSLEEE
jgi:GTP-binding protein